MHERRVSSNSDTPRPATITPTKVRESTDSNSPTISRYGRSHKPKLQDDFVSIDKKVSAYLKISPGNQIQFYSATKDLKKKASPKKIENAEETPKKRGRPPKTPTLNKSVSEDVTKMVIKAEPQDPSSPVEGCEWMVGDLAWARVGGHPFWPCVIALDPTQKIFTKIIRRGRNMASHRWLHVQFFGDNGRRSWLNSSAIMSFNGREPFIHLRDTCLAGIRKRDPKQSSAFVIKAAVIQVWEKAVQEAEDLLNASREERTEFFTRLFPPPPPPKLTRTELIERVLETQDTPQKKRGRKRKADLSPTEEEVKKKQIKLEPEEPKSDVAPATVNPLLSSTPRTIADRKKRQALLMQLARSNQTPPSPAPVTPPSTPSEEAAGKTVAVKSFHGHGDDFCENCFHPEQSFQGQ